MIEDVFRLFVVESVVGSTPGIALAVRVHEGTVRVGDHVRTATSPSGHTHEVNLEVQSLSMTENVHVDTLDMNYGGLATLFGPCPQEVGEGWELAG